MRLFQTGIPVVIRALRDGVGGTFVLPGDIEDASETAQREKDSQPYISIFTAQAL